MLHKYGQITGGMGKDPKHALVKEGQVSPSAPWELTRTSKYCTITNRHIPKRHL
jgi:hypothetical protein